MGGTSNLGHKVRETTVCSMRDKLKKKGAKRIPFVIHQ